ncbi:uncharacterized protein LOC144866128 [Branchiostoma floridae x Branchiostoma japonicum]
MAEEEHGGHSVDVRECFEKVIAEVSHKWDDLARKLGFKENDIKGIETLKPDQDRRCREVLHRWRNRDGSGATLQVLKQALIDIGERLTAESLEGKKPRKKRKRKRKKKAEQIQKEDSSEESSLVGSDAHAGPAPSRRYFPPVAKAVAFSWVKFAEDQLSLTAQDIHTIQQHPSSPEHQAFQALELWRDRRGRKACRVKLAQALRRGGFQHTADDLDRYKGQDVTTNGLSTEEPACIPDHNLQWKGYPHKKRKTQDPCGCLVHLKQESKQSNHVACAESNGTNTEVQERGVNGDGTPYLNGWNGNGCETNSSASWSSQHYQSSSLTSGEEPESDKAVPVPQQATIKKERTRKRKNMKSPLVKTKNTVLGKRLKSDWGENARPFKECTSLRKLPTKAVNTKMENNTEDKDSIYHAIVKMGEEAFDDKAYINLDEFAKTVQDLESFTAIVIKTEDNKKAKLSVQVKSEIKKRVNDKIAEVANKILERKLFNKKRRSTLHKMMRCFERFEAALRKAELGCVLCHLDFTDVGCYDTFWRGYSDGSLSDTLTRELVTDEMRAAEGGADLYIHVRVLDSATEDGDFSGQDPSGTAGRGPPHPGPSREHSGQGPPAPCNSNHGDDTSPGYHGDDTGGRQVSGGDDVIHVKQEPAEQVPSCCMMGSVKPEMHIPGMEVKEESSEQDRQFTAIADHLGSMWERLASSLGFNTDYIRDLTARLPPSLRPHQLICDWMERNVGDVTLEQLVQALRDAGIHEVADAADSGQLFVTEADCEAAKGKPDDDIDTDRTDDTSDASCGPAKDKSDEDMDTGRPDGDERLPEDTVSESSESGGSHGNIERRDMPEEDRNTYFDSGCHTSPLSPSMYPTGEDALAWNDCIQDFFKADEDTTKSIQQSWPSNILVKHLIRDRFFHSYLCEYWKQYQSFPDTVATFVEFVNRLTMKQFSFENDVSDDQFNTAYENISIVVGKAAFENHTNHNSVHVYKSQLQREDIQQSGFGWLTPVDSDEAEDAYQFVHDSIRQYLMAVWVAQTVRTQTDSIELLIVCANSSAHLPITCYSLAHLLGMAVSDPTYLSQFVTLLMQQVGGFDDFNHLLSVVKTTAESNQLGTLSSFMEKLFSDKTLDLSALPEISHHGLHCLTQLIKCTTLIQTIRLPENMSITNILKQYPFQYPFGRQPVSNVDHANQVKYLSYLPLFECIQSTSRVKSNLTTEYWIAETDKHIDVNTIHHYLQFGQSLQKISIRSEELSAGSLSYLSKSLLFTPNVTTIILALKHISSKDGEQAMKIFCGLKKLQNVKIIEYWPIRRFYGWCTLSVKCKTFSVYFNSRQKVWQGALSFCQSDIQELAFHGMTRGREDMPHTRDDISASYLPSIRGLKKLKAEFLTLRSSSWPALFKRLTSSEEDGKAPPLKVLTCTNCGLTSDDVLSLVGQLATLKNLEEIDLSHNNISDKAVPGLVESFGSCQNLKKVNLSHNKLSDRGDFLPPLPNLEEIDLSHNNISDKAVPGLVESFGSCKNLKKVNLSHNKLSDRGDFLPPLPNLEEIDLIHNAISDEAVPGLAEGFGLCQNLKHVHHSNNKISNKGALLLLLQDQCKRVQVETAGNNISDDLVCLLSNRENDSQSLEKIDLSHSDLTDEAVPALVQFFGLCQNLKKVNLSYNVLSERGDFLPPLPNLEEIDLSDNIISDKAVSGLAKGLGSCQNLKKVNLSYNVLSERGDFLPPLLNLEEIDLSHNIISDEAVPGLTEGLGSCMNLKTVSLSYNKLSDVEKLINVFSNLPTLTHLNIEYNSISDESLPTIAAWLKVRTDVNEVRLWSNTNRFSAEGVRDFVRTMKGKAYTDMWLGDPLYDGSKADVGESVESGEDVRREEQQWEKLRREKDLINVKVRHGSTTKVADQIICS